MAEGPPRKEIQLKLEVGSVLDLGTTRTKQEDALWVSDAAPHLFVVADGIGGHAKGAVASGMAVSIAQELHPALVPHEEFVEDKHAALALASLLQRTNTAIYEQNIQQGYHDKNGMGTTGVALMVYQRPDHTTGATYASVGDSRGYIYSPSTLRARRLYEPGSSPTYQLSLVTQPHSWAEYHRQMHNLDTERSASSVITRDLGAEPTVEVDTYTITVRTGDVMLLCSDGLRDAGVHREHLNKYLALVSEGKMTSQAACDELLRMARENGAPDNISVIITKVASGS